MGDHFSLKFLCNTSWSPLIGGNFADLLRNFKLSDGGKIEFSAITARLFLLPLLFFLGATYCPIPEGMDWLRKILIIQGSMPAGIFALVIVNHYGGRRHSSFTMHFGIYGSLFNYNPYMVVLWGETLPTLAKK